jgi:hypothetical protein
MLLERLAFAHSMSIATRVLMNKMSADIVNCSSEGKDVLGESHWLSLWIILLPLPTAVLSVISSSASSSSPLLGFRGDVPVLQRSFTFPTYLTSARVPMCMSPAQMLTGCLNTRLIFSMRQTVCLQGDNLSQQMRGSTAGKARPPCLPSFRAGVWIFLGWI